MIRRPVLLVALTAAVAAGVSTRAAEGPAPRLAAVPFTDVQITDTFWSPRFETNRTVTIPYCFHKCEETGRISNFAKAAGLMDGEHEGYYFNDSDVYKVIEGAAYALAAHEDPQLDAYLDGLIATIAAAQEEDGYLDTYYTLKEPDKKWTNVRVMHELYCAGHLFEAAVAHHQATGKRALLDVAIRLADHIDSIFGPGQRHDVPGHEEIEIGLVKLFHETGERRYLDLARFFIDQRGRAEGRELYGRYCQDHQPVIEQDTPVGHAVRAMYLYCGMADVAAETGDQAYIDALGRIWTEMVSRKIYLTGGIGSTRHGEAFGEAYDLPNFTAYNETCAAIGNALFNHRMNLLHADAAYADVLERILYNGFLSGISLSGDRFFYPNPLASRGDYHRSAWFGCSCCPVNVARFVPSIAGFVYAHTDDAIYVNLYIGSRATIQLPGTAIRIIQETSYPWDGTVRMMIHPAQEANFQLNVRIPGWATDSPMPGDLYAYDTRFALTSSRRARSRPSLLVNGQPVELPRDGGYASISRTWKAGDVVELRLPMPVRRVKAHWRVEADSGRLALQRGPIVYCLEAADHGGAVRHIWMPAHARFNDARQPDLLGGVTVLTSLFRTREIDEASQRVVSRPIEVTAIPYYAWDHREPGEMTVWIPTDPELAQAIGPPTLASDSRVSASHCWEHDTPAALNDRLEPASSSDESIPRLTWWDHRGTSEWVQYDLPAPARLSRAAVYFFDDTGTGHCRLPERWRLLYRDGEQWKPVPNPSGYAVAPDAFNTVTFDEIETIALRLEVKLKEGFSGGILEWRIN